MTSWQWLRREVAGAWRSMRYDLARRHALSRRQTEVLHPQYDAYEPRPPRRLAATASVGLLVAAGVAGTYFAIAGGLGVLANASTTPPGQAAGVRGGTSPGGRPSRTPAETGHSPVPARSSTAVAVHHRRQHHRPVRRSPSPSSSPSRSPGCPCSSSAPPSTPPSGRPRPSDSTPLSPSPTVSPSSSSPATP